MWEFQRQLSTAQNPSWSYKCYICLSNALSENYITLKVISRMNNLALFGDSLSALSQCLRQSYVNQSIDSNEKLKKNSNAPRYTPAF